ncbi:MAG: hypothetical protein JXA92_08340 [candidate division Zixibacteria bacterium]|nr:hypothetical protein [candidate division Zixibacteria bacterium]
MIDARFTNVLTKIYRKLEKKAVNWVITGSLGFALQGMPVRPNDIDLQTDKSGAYEIERLFARRLTEPVKIREEKKMRSHFGVLDIDGVRVEIMGDIQKKTETGGWGEPVELDRFKQFVEFSGMRVPVLSLAYEYRAYLALGRIEKALMLKEWLAREDADKENPDK